MPPFLSVYLDLVRVGAATLVLLSHVWPLVSPDFFIPWPGHQSVIIFFVLSGFVIAYVSDGRDATLGQYALNRLARLWSVAIPALLIASLAAPLVGTAEISGAAPPVPDAWANLIRTVQNLFFLGQVWHANTAPPLNMPFWSLNYEAWYYAIFGAWAFLRGPMRLPATLLLALAAGPAILLLMPPWLAGVALYRQRARLVLPAPAALALFLASGALYALLLKFDISTAFRSWLAVTAPQVAGYLGWSARFAGDWVMALVVSANFAAAASIGRYGSFLVKAKRSIQVVSSYTLSIYLYHMPLTALLVAVGGLHGGALAAALALAIVGLGGVTEHQRTALRRVLAWIVRVATRRRVAADIAS
jgi:peptidoglycan/LPS O-acetylase OafA/YrhL